MAKSFSNTVDSFFKKTIAIFKGSHPQQNNTEVRISLLLYRLLFGLLSTISTMLYSCAAFGTKPEHPHSKAVW